MQTQPHHRDANLWQARELDGLCDQFEACLAGHETLVLSPWIEKAPEEHRSALISQLVGIAHEFLAKAGVEDPRAVLLAANPEWRDEIDDRIATMSADAIAIGSFCVSTEDGRVGPHWPLVPNGSADPFAVGRTVAGRYLLVGSLGEGAMGRVFLANDLRLDRRVAIKVVSLRRQAEHESQRSLEREARLGASLSHRGLATVYDFGFEDERSFTVFEYVEGETLRQLLRSRGSLPLAEVTKIVAELADALDAAHSQGIVHRDLKPENVCRTPSGEFKVLDLGLAYVVSQGQESGAFAGTPAYCSPEQADRRPTDGRSDQYALGLVTYEMLTGEWAFRDKTVEGILRLRLQEQPPRLCDKRPELPAEVERAVLRALSRDPGDRFPNCQAFAAALGRGITEAVLPHIVSTHPNERIAFYFSHVSEESLKVRRAATLVENAGYACWFYSRDAAPGGSLFEQAKEAMARAQGTVLLVSRPALRSTDFEREARHAVSLDCPLLPVLVDVSREEFDRNAPVLSRLLSGAGIVEHRSCDSDGDLAERLIRSARLLGIHPSLAARSPKLRANKFELVGHGWATDAHQIDIDDVDRVLFHNDAVDEFLSNRNRHFVSATKGFGKTLLLTCKRRSLALASAEKGGSVIMSPEGRPYLDFMSGMTSLSHKHLTLLEDLVFTKRLWGAALRVATISHFPEVLTPHDSSDLSQLPGRIRSWLEGTRVEPTVAFKELTMQSVGDLNHLLDASENFLDQKMRRVHGSICFFIDKVDQAIHHLSKEAWVAVQAGLLEAAWEAMSANSHVKIYASIRQEAFSNYQSPIKSNLFAATTTLDYSETELRGLLDRLAQCYEGCGSFSEFLGANVVRHARRAAPEDSFQFVRRHTYGRPRDLVAMASEISSKRSTLNESRLREVVKRTSAVVVAANIFDEVRVFLDCLGDPDARARLFSLLPGNVLERSEAVEVAEAFNGLDAGTIGHLGAESEVIFHPFRDLYLTGLLGVVERDSETGVMTQRFRRPHDRLGRGASTLPESEHYLLHPALETFLQGQGRRDGFLQCHHLVVGENLPWNPHYPTLVQVEKQLSRVRDEAFVERAHHWVARVQGLLLMPRGPLARAEIESSDAWRELATWNGDDSTAEALLWMDELLQNL